jgi:hypothetical protein
MQIDKDRWIEIDLRWFDPDQLETCCIELMNKVKPLYEQVSGTRGMILCCNLLADLLTEWTGEGNQVLPFRNKSIGKWHGRTYRELKQLFFHLHRAALRVGIPDFKVGVFFVAWGRFFSEHEYDMENAFYERHRELYPRPFTMFYNLDPSVPMAEDRYPYATRPEGIQAGESFPDFFGDQWGHLCRYLELDAIHLRDAFAGEIIYARRGPFGDTASADPEQNKKLSDGVIRLFKAVKMANPEAIVMGYSSAVSAVADWRVGCVDFESLIADSGIDIWIDQTWPGAWADFRSYLSKSWTFQLSYLLVHRTMIEAANRRRDIPCKHYHLVETWDAFEHWDTLHWVPDKLRWGIWAYSHAAVRTPEGLRVPDGAYISWANNFKGDLWSDDDIRFIESSLTAAQRDAQAMEEVYGPQIVYHRKMMEWLMEEHPEWNVYEWIDEQAAWIMKWGVPCLSATRLEWLDPERATECLLLQTPGLVGQEDKARLLELQQRGQPMLLIGRSDVLDPELLQLAGMQKGSKGMFETGFHKASFARSGDTEDLPEWDWLILKPFHEIEPLRETEVLIEAEGMPLFGGNRRNRCYYWQPMDWLWPWNQEFGHRIQLGSVVPYVIVARKLQELSREQGLSYVQPMPAAEPFTMHLWKSGGHIHVLLGNLEADSVANSGTRREGTIVLRRRHLGLQEGTYMLRSMVNDEAVLPTRSEPEELVFDVSIQPHGSQIYRLAAF